MQKLKIFYKLKITYIKIFQIQIKIKNNNKKIN